MAIEVGTGWAAAPAEFREELAAHVLWEWSSQMETSSLAERLAPHNPDLHPMQLSTWPIC